MFLLATGFFLVLIGLWGMLTHRNILRIIISFSLMNTGLHVVMVATGYVTGGTAPIIDEALDIADATSRAVDPVPAALVVTAIVIGFSVTAVMLAFAIRLYDAQEDPVHRRDDGVEMVDGLVQPLNIYLLGLGGGFLIPLLYHIAKPLPAMAFLVALGGFAAISVPLFLAAPQWRTHRGDPHCRQRAALLDQPSLWFVGRSSSPPASMSQPCLGRAPFGGACAEAMQLCCSILS